nr:DUF559 domain-containing protein [Ornithinimicrobium cryptoxanthini]
MAGPDSRHSVLVTRHTTFDTTRPFLRQQALKAGLTKHQLDGPAFHSIFGSVRLSTRIALDTRARAESALLLVNGGVASHHTAAVIWGGVVPDTALTHVTVPADDARRHRPNLRCHVGSVRCTRARGVRVTTPEQTFYDLAGHLDLVDLVVLGDSLVQAGASTPARLTQFVSSRRSARARTAAALVRSGVESPMETRVRLMIVLAGLPEPEINLTIRAAQGRAVYRLDLAWPDLRLAVEYDGRQHAESPHQWGRDVTRREHLDDAGWRVIVLRAPDVYDTPWESVGRIMAAMAARGFETDATECPEPFRAQFPGRPWRSNGVAR